jgi:hypothetical protein
VQLIYTLSGFEIDFLMEKREWRVAIALELIGRF